MQLIFTLFCRFLVSFFFFSFNLAPPCIPLFQNGSLFQIQHCVFTCQRFEVYSNLSLFRVIECSREFAVIKTNPPTVRMKDAPRHAKFCHY